MKKLLALALVATGAIAVAGFRSPTPGHPEVGSAAPEIGAKTWFNHIGRPLDLESLKGQAVMLEFWATWCGPCVAAWPHVQELHDEYADQGLVVLALSSEDEKTVSSFLDQRGFSVRTASGSTASGPYGIEGIPKTFLIDAEGKIAWHGHPSELSDKKIKELLKGVKKRSNSFLAVPIESEPAGKLAAPAKSMASGNPGKALSALRGIADDAKATDAEKAEATTLIAAIDEHVALLNQQADGFVSARDVLTGLTVYDALAKEFAGMPPGDAAKKRAEEIRGDAKLSQEIAAAEAFARAQEQAAKLGSSKAKAKFQEVADKYKGTRGGERAAAMLRGKKD